MEENPTPVAKTRKRWPLFVALALTAALLVGIGLYLSGLWTRLLPAKSLKDIVPGEGVVVTRLRLDLYDSQGRPWSGASRLGPLQAGAWGVAPPCKAVAMGGDRVPAPRVDDLEQSAPTAEKNDKKGECPRWMVWNLIRHPTGLTVRIREGKEVAEWFSRNPDFEALRKTELFQGLFLESLETLRLKGSDLRLAGFAGEFVGPFLEDALGAEAAFSYDVIHGQGGFVFSFHAGKARLASYGIHALVTTLASEGLEVRGLDSPVWGFRLGSRKVYAAQKGKRFYLASSAAGLLNVIDGEGDAAPAGGSGSLAATVRLEAWLGEGFMETLFGKKNWSLQATFALSKEKTVPEELVTERFPALSDLRPALAPSVLESIPADTLAVAALSAPVTKELSADYLADFSRQSGRTFAFPPSAATKAGVAVAWRLGANGRESGGLTELGLVVDDGGNELGNTLRGFFRDPSLVRYCPARKVWLVASHDDFLRDLLSACNGTLAPVSSVVPMGNSIEALLGVNLVHLVRETYRGGGGVAASPSRPGESAEAQQARAEADKALLSLREHVEADALRLPVFGFMGGGTGGRLALRGFVTPQDKVHSLYKESRP